jgi:antitoxin PrlF
MKYSSSISSKGQVTVPQEIRNRLGLSAGDRVEFAIEGDRTVIRPARAISNPFEKYIGVLGTFPGGPDEINVWLRELRDEEPDRR